AGRYRSQEAPRRGRAGGLWPPPADRAENRSPGRRRSRQGGPRSPALDDRARTRQLPRRIRSHGALGDGAVSRRIDGNQGGGVAAGSRGPSPPVAGGRNPSERTG